MIVKEKGVFFGLAKNPTGLVEVFVHGMKNGFAFCSCSILCGRDRLFCLFLQKLIPLHVAIGHSPLPFDGQ
jgi:hypothetical protein